MTLAVTQQPRVLVVDDDAGIRMLCAVTLRLAGLDVLEAEDGRRGFERALADLPDVVVLDVMMPCLDGFGLADQLRADERTSRIPILFLTAESAPAHRSRARALGALDYITKPFDPAVLAGVVARALTGAGNEPAFAH